MYGILLSRLAGANCHIDMLDKLQKRICRTVGSWPAGFLEPLPHSQTGAIGSTSFSRGRSTRYSDRLHDFSVTIPRCYKNVYVNSFFPCTARLWKSLPTECFPLTYDLNDFLSLQLTDTCSLKVLSEEISCMLDPFVLLFLVTPCLVLASQPCVEWIPIKKKTKSYLT